MSFKAVAAKIANRYRRKGVSAAKAKEIGAGAAANAARNASPAAKRANPNLRRVRGANDHDADDK